MRILNLQNTVLVSLLVAGGAALAACGSSDASRPDATAGSGDTTSSAGSDSTAGGSGSTAGGSTSSGAGATSTAGSTSSVGGGSGGSAPASVCDGAGTKVLTTDNAFIEDFEEAMISPGWSSFNDLGAPGVDAADNMFKMMQVAGGAVGTAHSGEYQGTGANTTKTAPGFGVGTIFNVAIDNSAMIYCADISAFDGISFWAKTGIAGSTVNVNFVLPSTNAKSTDPTLGGGDCTAACYNHPYKTVTLTSDWQNYTVKFSDAKGGSALVKNVIQELGWLSPDAAWDFSLDEIAFYKGTAPTGPVGTGSGGASSAGGAGSGGSGGAAQ
jgi:hypothetical protein